MPQTVEIPVERDVVDVVVSDADIARVRRMTVEPTTAIYSDALLAGFIANEWRHDHLGLDPRATVEVWTPTYDLNAVAAIVWSEKAAGQSDQFDFEADGGKWSRSQKYTQAERMARRYRSLSCPRPVRFSKDRGLVDLEETQI